MDLVVVEQYKVPDSMVGLSELRLDYFLFVSVFIESRFLVLSFSLDDELWTMYIICKKNVVAIATTVFFSKRFHMVSMGSSFGLYLTFSRSYQFTYHSSSRCSPVFASCCPLFFSNRSRR